MAGRDIVRQYFEPYSGVDFKVPVLRAIEARESGGDAGVIAALGPAWEVLAPEIEWDTSPIAGDGPQTRYRGLAAFIDFWDEWLSVWEEYVYTVVEYVECGPAVVANLEVAAVGQGGIPANWRVAQACEVEDGKIVRMRAFPSLDEAVDAIEHSD